MNNEAGHVVVVKSPYGLFAVDTKRDNKIFKHLGEHSHHQNESVLLLKHFINKDSVVADVGAHIGTITIPLARWVKKVIAFEPSPITFEFLKRNVALNNIQNIDARNKGLGSRAGFASLEETPRENAGAQMLNAGAGTIPISTLDVEIPEVTLIKIDVEGMEPEVFKGAERLIGESKPVIFSEVNVYALRAHGFSPSDMERFFKSHGYRLFFPFEKDDEICLARISHLTLIAALINPGAFIRGGMSMTFDVLAVPTPYQMPSKIRQIGFGRFLFRLIVLNLTDKARRLKKIFRR